MNATQESQAAQQQIRAEREMEMRRRAMQPMSPQMPMARPPMPPQMRPPMQPGMQRPPMAPAPQGGVVRPGTQPGAPDPRAALLRAILAQAQQQRGR